MLQGMIIGLKLDLDQEAFLDSFHTTTMTGEILTTPFIYTLQRKELLLKDRH